MKMKCEKCGAQMIDRSKGPYVHFVCSKCGHALATYDYTKEDPIKIDRTIYSLKSIDNKISPKFIKIISKANCISRAKEIGRIPKYNFSIHLIAYSIVNIQI